MAQSLADWVLQQIADRRLDDTGLPGRLQQRVSHETVGPDATAARLRIAQEVSDRGPADDPMISEVVDLIRDIQS